MLLPCSVGDDVTPAIAACAVSATGGSYLILLAPIVGPCYNEDLQAFQIYSTALPRGIDSSQLGWYY